MADQSNNCTEQQEAVEAADRVLEKVEKHAADGLKPQGDTLEAVVKVAEEVDSDDAEKVRQAAMRRH